MTFLGELAPFVMEWFGTGAHSPRVGVPIHPNMLYAYELIRKFTNEYNVNVMYE